MSDRAKFTLSRLLLAGIAAAVPFIQGCWWQKDSYTAKMKQSLASGGRPAGVAGQWYYAKGGETVGPVTLDELVSKLSELGGLNAQVYGPGVPEWKAAGEVPEVAQKFKGE